MNRYYKTMARAAAWNIFLGMVALSLEAVFAFPAMPLSFATAAFAFVVLMLIYSVVMFEAVAAFPPNSGDAFPWLGPYAKSRHPMFAAVVFILNPAIAFLLRSWFLLIAVFFAYVLWHNFARAEEARMLRECREAYLRHVKTVPMFLPRIGVFGLLRFGATVLFALAALALLLYGQTYAARFAYDVKRNILDYRAEEAKSPRAPALPASQNGGNGGSEERVPRDFFMTAAKYIRIEKIGVDAPIIAAQSPDTAYINELLNSGAVLYPGYDPETKESPMILIGHSSAYPWVRTSYGRLFALLDKLERGDEIVISVGGKEERYAVTKKDILSNAEKDYGRIEALPPRSLVLITCWPPGTTLKRYMVAASPLD